MKGKFSEKGQAIVLIAFAIIGLLGLVALALDGGQAFSDRRRAQNAADAAALAVALAYNNSKVTPSNAQLTLIALQSTTSNGYDGDGVRSDVDVSITPAAEGTAKDQCPVDTEGLDIAVTLDSYLPTWFAQIVGIPEVHNQVSSTSRACKAFTQAAAFGNAVVALSDDKCALTVGGNGTTIVTGSGLYTNGGFCDNGNAGKLTAPGGIAADSCTQNGSRAATYTCNTTAPPLPTITWPDAPVCTKSAVKTSFGIKGSKAGSWTAGNITGSDIEGDDVLGPGIYCVTGSISLTGGSLTGHNIMLYFKDKGAGFGFSGNATDIQLSAMADSSAYTNPPTTKYSGLLIYMKPLTEPVGPSDRQTININGGATTNLIGAIWAPSGDITLNGNSGNTEYKSQVIGWTVTVTGTTYIETEYNDNENSNIIIPPTIQILR